MSVTIPFPPEIEAKLRASAAAAGKDIDTFIREAVEEKLRLSANIGRSADQWTAEFDEWMREVATRASLYPSGDAADDSRENIYEGRGDDHDFLRYTNIIAVNPVVFVDQVQR